MSVNVKVTTSSGNKISVSPKTNKNNVVVSRRAVLSSESTSDKNYVHEQGSPSATWTINHNLSKFPSVSIVDSAGTLIIAEVEYVSTSQVVITFDASTSGKAYLN
jgi:hypothetical protein